MSSFMDFVKALAGICKTPVASPEVWELRGSEVSLDVESVPELRGPSGAVRLEGMGLPNSVLVVHKPDGGFLCVKNRCTHMGRKLDPGDSDETLRCCSVSHSVFDHDGAKVSGPAKGDLIVYPSRMEGTKLIISVS